jgi:hypothetical protein
LFHSAFAGFQVLRHPQPQLDCAIKLQFQLISAAAPRTARFRDGTGAKPRTRHHKSGDYGLDLLRLDSGGVKVLPRARRSAISLSRGRLRCESFSGPSIDLEQFVIKRRFERKKLGFMDANDATPGTFHSGVSGPGSERPNNRSRLARRLN